jgi:hypothetical protein
MVVLVLRCILGGLLGATAGLQLWMDANRIDDDW